MIHTACKTCRSSGWCEYDPFTDTVYPADPINCPLINQNKGDANDKPKDPAPQR